MVVRVYNPEFDSKQKPQGPQTIGTQGFAGLWQCFENVVLSTFSW